MQEIPLTQGQIALVDDEDYAYLSQWEWYAQRSSNTWYAGRKVPNGTNRQLTRWMHIDIIRPDGGLEVDHHNRNGLDNQRSNLRVATHAQNQHNAGRRRDNSSGYKGVSWRSDSQKWGASICLQGKVTRLGSFAAAEDAAHAYDAAARAHFGKFARCNFHDDGVD
jgi:hypothetical protein